MHKKGYFAIIKKLCFDALTGQSGNALKPPDGLADHVQVRLLTGCAQVRLLTVHVHVRLLTGFAHGRNEMI